MQCWELLDDMYGDWLCQPCSTTRMDDKCNEIKTESNIPFITTASIRNANYEINTNWGKVWRGSCRFQEEEQNICKQPDESNQQGMCLWSSTLYISGRTDFDWQVEIYLLQYDYWMTQR